MTGKLLLLVLSTAGLMVIAGCAGNPAPTQAPEASATTPALNEAPYPAGGEPVTGSVIAGSVVSGGDQSPAGLQDTPRTYVYQVLQADGTQVDVTYTAYPPSPAGDQQRVTLEFHSGQIQVGDWLEARGQYDPAARTLTVSQDSDYIRTFPAAPGGAYP